MTKEKKMLSRRNSASGELPMREIMDSLPIALLKAREAVMVPFRALLNEYDLTDQQWRVLRVLMETAELEVVELAKRCVILQPSVSRILKKLEERRLVKRKTLLKDRRCSHISITKEGRALFRKVAPKSEVIYNILTNKIGQDKLDSLMANLHEITLKLEE